MPPPYGQSLALLTDLYQLTMAYGYWREGLADREAVFHQFFRKAPFGGGFAVAAGLGPALRWLREFRFQPDDLDYLAGLQGDAGQPLFEPGFLDYLAGLEFACEISAVPEGTVVFPQEPLLRVRGPLLQAQLVETALLNIVNFQTLVATKATRVCLAAGEDPVLEFGLRRAQGIDGGLSASRAAYIGGCAATSNVLAGKLYGIPVRGTHAHSWVLSFDSELEAFKAFARAMPHNCVILVDTYDTLQGVRHAVEVGQSLRRSGRRLAGIRLDSGDLAGLSQEAWRLLSAAGLDDTAIVASNDLDEFRIAKLKREGAQVGVWGVGTSIASAHGDSALGGVYKLALLRDGAGRWRGRAKRSEEPSKATLPGMLQVRRFLGGDRLLADIVYDELHPPTEPWAESASGPPGAVLELGADMEGETLLRPAPLNQDLAEPDAQLGQARERRREQLRRLPREMLGPETMGIAPVFFESGLLRQRAHAWSRSQCGEQRS